MSPVERLTEEQIEARLGVLEAMMSMARHPDDLRALREAYQWLVDELVRRDVGMREGARE